MTEHGPCVCVHELNRVSLGQTTTDSKTTRRRGVCSLTQIKQHFHSIKQLLYSSSSRFQDGIQQQHNNVKGTVLELNETVELVV